MTELSAESRAKNQHLRLFYLFNVTVSECASLEKGPDHPSSAQGAGRASRGWKVGVNLNGSTVNHRANAERPQVCYASQQDGTRPTD